MSNSSFHLSIFKKWTIAHRAYFAHNLKIFLRGIRATLLVHDVSASEHDLHSDDDRNVLAHLGSGGSDNWKAN